MTDTEYVFELPDPLTLGIHGQTARYPVNRIFCVGMNYADHVREMGNDPGRRPPVFFTKSTASAVAVDGTGAIIPMAPATSDYHHEVELVIALGTEGFNITAEQAHAMIWGYGCGLDMTRRDLQRRAKDTRTPWDMAKNVEASAVLSPLTQTSDVLKAGRIWLSRNDNITQDGDLSEMIWSVPEIIADLSRYYHLRAGDLIFTGTPAGVGPVEVGDTLEGGIEGVGTLKVQIGDVLP